MNNCGGMLPNLGNPPGYEYGQQYAAWVGLEIAHQQALQGYIAPIMNHHPSSEDYLLSLITRLCTALERAQWPGGEPKDTELIKEARHAVQELS